MDPPAAEEPAAISPDEYIAKKLALSGICLDQVNSYTSSLICYVSHHPSEIRDIAGHILEAGTLSVISRMEQRESGGESSNFYSTSLKWLEWLMFKNNPAFVLEELAKKSAGQRAVCGSVWGKNDLAYRCRTCEHDPTCAICVPCFQNGNHKDHDYSIMYTGGGCCDCGDATAWKREGFCSRHKGSEHILPLPHKLECSVGPVVDTILQYWLEKVCSIDMPINTRSESSSSTLKVANELSNAIVTMLIEFCKCSESLLSFISKRMYECADLLDVLLRAERKLEKKVVKKLDDLFLNLIIEPTFKYEFAKAFTRYYPVSVKEVIKQSNNSSVEESPVLSSFSVQIYTVPSLAARLVHEIDLLGVLLDCLKDLFQSCAGDDGRLQASKWANLYETSVRLVEDIRFVLSHEEVMRYVVYERKDVIDSWIELLSLIQGMDPQKRMTIHAEDENENLAAPFMLAYYLGHVHKLLVQGLSSIANNQGSTSQIYLSIDENFNMGDSELIPQQASSLALNIIGVIERHLEPWTVEICDLTSFHDSDSIGTSSNLRKRPFMHAKSLTKSAKVGFASQHFGSHNSSVHALTAGRTNIRNDVANLHPANALSSASSDGSLPGVDDGENKQHLLDSSAWRRITFDVASQEVSFHIPLHRLLSLLLQTTMNKIFGKDDYHAASSGIQLYTPSYFFDQFLKGYSYNSFAAFVMEHPLRVRVICAQVRAGMWRKNGDAALLSIEWYRSVQLFEQGLESDLFLLQCCAALAPSELFVETLQDRFGLSNYTSLQLNDFNEFEPVLVQEMLTLLIQIVKERRFCGLSAFDTLKREVIYKLAVGDATHSQIVKSLPSDLSGSDQLQSVLDMLAGYSNPSGLKQGKYSLRKSYWNELDLYHPRWSFRELQLAEERYYNACKVSALNAQLPRWTDAFPPLSNISRIAISKAALRIVRAVLFYSVNSTGVWALSRVPDNVLVTALHLISLALDICDSKAQLYISQIGTNEPLVGSSYAEGFLPFLEYATEVIVMDSGARKKESLLSLLVSLLCKCKIENDGTYTGAKYCDIYSLIYSQLKKFAELSKECLTLLREIAPDVVSSIPGASSPTVNQDRFNKLLDRKTVSMKRQAAIMEKMKAAQSKFAESLMNIDAEESEEAASNHGVNGSNNGISEESLPVCSLCRESDSQSPLCYLILLQKSRLVTFVERVDSPEIRNQCSKKFGARSIEESADAADAETSSPMQIDQESGANWQFERGNSDVNLIGLFGEQLRRIKYHNPHNVCSSDDSESFESLKMMEHDIFKAIVSDFNSSSSRDNSVPSYSAVCSEKSRTTRCPILGTYVACISKELKQNCSSAPAQPLEALSKSSSMDRFGPRGCDGIHISSCGHAMHQECHSRYLQSLKQRFVRRLGFEGGHIVDPDLGELLCPVCRRFANSIFPASPNIASKDRSMTMSLIPIQETPTLSSSAAVATTNLQFPIALSLLQSASRIVGQDKYLRSLSSKRNDPAETALEACIQRLNMLYYPSSSSIPPDALNQSMFLWDTVRYTLVSTEIAARGRMRTYSPGSRNCLESLHHELSSSGGFILSLLSSVAHSARSMNHLDVLLRFKGIQLLESSIISGACGDDELFSANKRKGTLLPIFDQASSRTAFPHQFWKQCADPIIAHDPFTSLLWVLYCLPLPVLSSREFLFPLVHLFYVVSVVQSLIACYMQEGFDTSSFSDCLLDGVCKTMLQYRHARQIFAFDYTEQMCDPKDAVRRLTFPFLRRCALLLRLLSSPSTTPLYRSSNIWELSSAPMDTNSSESGNRFVLELSGLKELEDHLHIPSLEMVLRDESVHALALRWCQHYAEGYINRKSGGVFFSRPALPFKLMQLPTVYQDLLERYVKMQCSDCGTVPDEPTLCLLCGKLCAPNWKPCCSTSKCINHAKECGAGVGVFLLVRKTTIMLQRSARLAFWPSPYLDAFGEEDHDIHRGKPLYLSQERYAALTYLVASHSLDQTSEVLRQTTIGLFGAE